MKPHIKVDITAGTIAAMTTEQFVSLRDNVCREGRWENSDGLRINGGGDYIGVEPLSGSRPDVPGAMTPIMFIGIEKDGYTHS